MSRLDSWLSTSPFKATNEGGEGGLQGCVELESAKEGEKSESSAKRSKVKGKGLSDMFKTAREVEMTSVENSEIDRKGKRTSESKLDNEPLAKKSCKSENCSKIDDSSSGKSSHDKKSHTTETSQPKSHELFASSNHKRRIAHKSKAERLSEMENLAEKNVVPESVSENTNVLKYVCENSVDKDSEVVDAVNVPTPEKENPQIDDNSPPVKVVVMEDKSDVSSNKSQPSKAADSNTNKKKVADWVVKYLMPFYTQQKITSRDLFKLLARKMSHHVLLCTDAVSDESVVKKRVKEFFKNHETVSSEADITF